MGGYRDRTNKGKDGTNQVSKYSSVPIPSVVGLALIVFRV